MKRQVVRFGAPRSMWPTLTVEIEWRLANRLGVQGFGAQHVAALGDLETSARTAENVMGNFWSVGAAVVIR